MGNLCECTNDMWPVQWVLYELMVEARSCTYFVHKTIRSCIYHVSWYRPKLTPIQPTGLRKMKENVEAKIYQEINILLSITVNGKWNIGILMFVEWRTCYCYVLYPWFHQCNQLMLPMSDLTGAAHSVQKHSNMSYRSKHPS